jgi:hypothetical protein
MNAIWMYWACSVYTRRIRLARRVRLYPLQTSVLSERPGYEHLASLFIEAALRLSKITPFAAFLRVSVGSPRFPAPSPRVVGLATLEAPGRSHATLHQCCGGGHTTGVRLYFSTRRGPRLRHFPELSWPPNFSRRELREWIAKIDDSKLRVAVTERWDVLRHKSQP